MHDYFVIFHVYIVLYLVFFPNMSTKKAFCGHPISSADKHILCSSCRTCTRADPVVEVCASWTEEAWLAFLPVIPPRKKSGSGKRSSSSSKKEKNVSRSSPADPNQHSEHSMPSRNVIPLTSGIEVPSLPSGIEVTSLPSGIEISSLSSEIETSSLPSGIEVSGVDSSLPCATTGNPTARVSCVPLASSALEVTSYEANLVRQGAPPSLGGGVTLAQASAYPTSGSALAESSVTFCNTGRPVSAVPGQIPGTSYHGISHPMVSVQTPWQTGPDSGFLAESSVPGFSASRPPPGFPFTRPPPSVSAADLPGPRATPGFSAPGFFPGSPMVGQPFTGPQPSVSAPGFFPGNMPTQSAFGMPGASGSPAAQGFPGFAGYPYGYPSPFFGGYPMPPSAYPGSFGYQFPELAYQSFHGSSNFSNSPRYTSRPHVERSRSNKDKPRSKAGRSGLGDPAGPTSPILSARHPSPRRESSPRVDSPPSSPGVEPPSPPERHPDFLDTSTHGEMIDPPDQSGSEREPSEPGSDVPDEEPIPPPQVVFSASPG